MVFRLPVPPLLPLQARTENVARAGSSFTSPAHTPQGSPSKHRFPPGAHELPDYLDEALDLGQRLELTAPPKGAISTTTTTTTATATIRAVGPTPPSSYQHGADSPRRTDKENVSPAAAAAAAAGAAGAAGRPAFPKEPSFLNHAAASRQEPYRATAVRDRKDGPGTAKFAAQPVGRGLSADELDKLQKPSVRRLANVTQLYFLDYYYDLLSYTHARQTRMARFDEQHPPPPQTAAAEYELARSKYLGRERANLRKRRTRLRQGDFQILTQVGQGGYGQVFLAQKRDTKEVCALKVMSKRLLFKLDEIKHVLTERDILTTAKSDWLVRLLYAFQDEQSIYLAMEYVPGGDFRTLLNGTGILHNRYARFYISEMFVCIDALHQLGYIHRDLKPENFLIDALGHVKLTDFGLAAGFLAPAKIESMRVRLEQVGQMADAPAAAAERSMAERRSAYRSLRERDVNYARSVVGSPDYMAPEVLRGEQYNFTVDYWSLGCMLYEALAGFPPFSGATVDETWLNLKNWRRVLQRPEYEDANYFLSKRTWNVIERLVASQRQRFQTFADIRAHPYFAEVDWDRLRQQRAPFVPQLDGDTDPGYFDDFSSEADMAKYKEVHDKQQAIEAMADRDDKLGKTAFVGFTFRHRRAAGDDAGRRKAARPADEDRMGTML